MSYQLFLTRLLPSMITVCVFLPGRGSAQQPPVALPPVPPPSVQQPPAQLPADSGIGNADCPGCVGANRDGAYSHGKYGKQWPPPPPPYWNYYGLPNGPYITTGYPFYGWPGYRGAFGSYWTNGLSLYGPPVPVYGPIPGVFGNSDLVHQWASRPTLGAGALYVGWVGPFRASPRPRPSVNVWPVVESMPGPAVVTGPAPAPGACLHLSVKVPQPAAEVFVDGVKTVQTGTDRIFESPPLEGGKEYRYEVTVRWVERGATFERTKVVTAKPGEVVRVDLTAPDVVLTGR